ncbi:uncharacterized protein VICG_01563 [Vittaforma corneae ATCC 50505]|uniref:C2H2-type domain-containing protein n=1 Tax=Vittaforma corneae (strain ATCC 50505) TaxID=993615 RepID=L2GKP6_VITCO|nr:uncharacterized protein VICG_01563 [Vittaforma corneae ATCC 50505]ELA41458.1 hypothetical protein VICG_01563 [Vittaforma corneae ATCC 50505]
MYCTICETKIEDLHHYKSELHSLNARRKFLGYPPLSLEEFDSQSISDDLTIDLNISDSINIFKVSSSDKPKEVNSSESIASIETNRLCVFCDQNHSIAHYRLHNLSDEQGFYLTNTQCYICYERFSDRNMLIKHLELELHRTAVTDGISLFLENGKILNPHKMNMPLRTIFKPEKDSRATKSIDIVFKSHKRNKN